MKVDGFISMLNVVGCELYFRGIKMTKSEGDSSLFVIALAVDNSTISCNPEENFKLLNLGRARLIQGVIYA